MNRVLVLVLVLVACGGGDGVGHLTDAPLPVDAALSPDGAIDGAMIDGAMPDSPVGGGDRPVTLTVTSAGAPVAGAHVYFLNTDNSVMMMAATSAEGTASAVMAAGGSVTILDPFPGQRAVAVGSNELVTFLGIKPGDHLAVTRSARDSVAVVVTATHAIDATRYDVVTTCGSGSIASPRGEPASDPSGTVNLEGCHGAADIAVVARSVDPKTGVSTPILGLLHADALLTDNGPVNLTGDSYAPLADVTFTYTHAPGTPLEIDHAPLLGHGPLGPFTVNITGETETIHEPMVSAASSAVTMSVDVDSGTHKVMDWGPSSATYTLDLAGVLLPEMPGPPAFDFATGAVTWTEAAQGAVPDATVLVLEIARSAPARDWTWLVIAPHAPGQLALPRLPTDIADWIPVAGDSAFIDHVSSLKLTGGYDALRARTIDFGGNDLTLISGPAGRLVSMISMSSSGIAAPASRNRDRRRARRSLFGPSR